MQSAPRRLGRYEVVSRLAQGGMAELFLARLPGIEGFARKVVIKRVLPALARDRDFVEMFLEEARLAATLQHQNIVAVLDIDHDDDGYFFAMEYLHGADLGELLRSLTGDGGLPLQIALEIARGACAGLHHAHGRKNPAGAALGIVHRDVSPQNIFITFDGGVKLLDFGIAKAVQQSPSHYTRSGALRGKLPYMSPEQCRGLAIDRRSDVFSLAIVLWETTVGDRLFGGQRESDFEVLKAIVEIDAPRPSTRKPAYPPALEAIVMKGLARDRERRYQSCDELQGELEAFMRTHHQWATPRDLAQYMIQQFGERAASSMKLPAAADAAGGEVVPFPRVTRVVAPPGADETIDLPRPEHRRATPPQVPPGGALHGMAPGSSPHPTSPPVPDGMAPAAVPYGVVAGATSHPTPPVASPHPTPVGAAPYGMGSAAGPQSVPVTTIPYGSPQVATGPDAAPSPHAGAGLPGSPTPSGAAQGARRSGGVAVLVGLAAVVVAGAVAVGFWLGRGAQSGSRGDATATGPAAPATRSPSGGSPPGGSPPGASPAGTSPAGTSPPGTSPPGTSPPGTSPPGTAATPAARAIVRTEGLALDAEVSGLLAAHEVRRYPFTIQPGRYYVELFVKAPDPLDPSCNQPRVTVTMVDRDDARIGDVIQTATWDRDSWEKKRASYDLSGQYGATLRASDCRVHYRLRIVTTGP